MARQALGAAILLTLVLLLGGCLGGGSGSDGPANVAGATIGGSIRDANCKGWRTAGPSARKNTIHDLTSFAGGPVGERPGTGATLSDQKAYGLFEGACRPYYARGFKLYKLYTRGAAFQKLERSNR